jgi:cathepsin L
MELGFEWVRDNGLYTEWEYPYESFTGTVPSCDNGTIYPLAAIKNFTLLPSNDYESVIRALAMKGPLAISVDASEWGSYKKGVFNGCNTKNPDINHGVLLVGYGEDEETKEPYWLIKNSWGPIWGEKGYIRIRRDVNGTVCGVDTSPAHGIACEGSGITSMKVCGTCGVLFDASFPTGVYIHED